MLQGDLVAARLHVAAATGPHPPFLWELYVLPEETAGLHLARVGLCLCGMRSGLHPTPKAWGFTLGEILSRGAPG